MTFNTLNFMNMLSPGNHHSDNRRHGPGESSAPSSPFGLQRLSGYNNQQPPSSPFGFRNAEQQQQQHSPYQQQQQQHSPYQQQQQQHLPYQQQNQPQNINFSFSNLFTSAQPTPATPGIQNNNLFDPNAQVGAFQYGQGVYNNSNMGYGDQKFFNENENEEQKIDDLGQIQTSPLSSLYSKTSPRSYNYNLEKKKFLENQGQEELRKRKEQEEKRKLNFFMPNEKQTNPKTFMTEKKQTWDELLSERHAFVYYKKNQRLITILVCYLAGLVFLYTSYLKQEPEKDGAVSLGNGIDSIGTLFVFVIACQSLYMKFGNKIYFSLFRTKPNESMNIVFIISCLFVNVLTTMLNIHYTVFPENFFWFLGLFGIPVLYTDKLCYFLCWVLTCATNIKYFWIPIFSFLRFFMIPTSVLSYMCFFTSVFFILFSTRRVWKYLQPAPNYANVGLTAKERKLYGLKPLSDKRMMYERFTKEQNAKRIESERERIRLEQQQQQLNKLKPLHQHQYQHQQHQQHNPHQLQIQERRYQTDPYSNPLNQLHQPYNNTLNSQQHDYNNVHENPTPGSALTYEQNLTSPNGNLNRRNSIVSPTTTNVMLSPMMSPMMSPMHIDPKSPLSPQSPLSPNSKQRIDSSKALARLVRPMECYFDENEEPNFQQDDFNQQSWHTGGKYQTAVSNPVRMNKAKAQGENGIVGHQKGPEKQILKLRDLKIYNNVDSWVENIRIWLASTILGNLVKRVDEVDKVFISQGVGLYKCGALGEQEKIKLLQNKDVIYSYEDKIKRVVHQVQVSERLQIQKYLEVAGFKGSEEYVLSRIRGLVQNGKLIYNYAWNVGGNNWNSTLPTDAQLIFHLFCTFMDIYIPEKSVTTEQPFTTGFTSKGAVPDRGCVSDVCICQTEKNPPNFQLAVRRNEKGEKLKKWEYWAPDNGRNNLFHTLILFVYFVKTRMKGYIGYIDIGSSNLQLRQVVER